MKTWINLILAFTMTLLSHGVSQQSGDAGNVLENLLISNSRWAEGVLRFQPKIFNESSKGQSPNILWIGCSDSRVPESVITLARPGDIFVQRNIANQVHLNDSNGLSVIEYAVEHLGVEHIIVVGHSGCGGAAASLQAAQANPNADPNKPIVTLPDSPTDSPLNMWLEPLTKLAISLKISYLPQEEALPIVVLENVKAQVRNLAETEAVSTAWERGKSLHIHGWVYNIGTGYLQDLQISQPISEVAF